MAIAIALALTISLASRMGDVKMAKANPFFIFNQIDPDPKTIPPKITISSPQNNTSYLPDQVIVNFEVDRPQLGSCNTAIIDVKYVLDNSPSQAFSIWRGGSASNGWAVPEFNTIFTLPWVPRGNHNFTVTAEGVVYAGGMDIFFISSASTTSFTININLPQETPSPTPTQTPTTSPNTSPHPTTATPSPTPNYSKPSIPEFSINANEATIELIIKNQPFDESLNYSFYYNIRYRVDGGNWTEVYKPNDGFPTRSSGDYTILLFSSSNENKGHFLDTSTNPLWSFSIDAPANSILEVQAKAMIGYVQRVFNPNATSQIEMYPYIFAGESSNWSDTRTIITPDSLSPNEETMPLTTPSYIPSMSPSVTLSNSPNRQPSIAPNTSSSVPEFQSLVILVLFLIITSIIVTTYNKGKKKESELE
jgi:hypothetical protein